MAKRVRTDPAFRRMWIAAAAAYIAAASPAAALQFDPFAELVGRDPKSDAAEEARTSISYVAADDTDETFRFEDRGERAYIQFDCDPAHSTLECRLADGARAEEIIALRPSYGARGDTLYKSVTGAPVLRLTAFGAATVYELKASDAEGVGAARAGEAPPLAPPAMTREQAVARAAAAEHEITALTGAPIAFVLPPSRGPDATALADVILVAAKGVGAVAADTAGARVIGERLARIVFARGKTAKTAYADGALTVTYTPDFSVEGRPSSEEIRQYLENTI